VAGFPEKTYVKHSLNFRPEDFSLEKPRQTTRHSWLVTSAFIFPPFYLTIFKTREITNMSPFLRVHCSRRQFA